MKNMMLCTAFAAVFLLAGAGLSVYGSGRPQGDGLPEEVVIGYQIIPNGEIIAKDRGWHEETLGVPVKWVQMNSASETNTAIAAGSIDFGLGGSSGIAAGIATGVPYKVIWIYDIIGDNEALVARRGSGIREVSDLAGKTVAVPFAATTHYHLLAALGLSDVGQESLKILDMQPPDILAAWQRDDIDATFVWEPTLAKLIELDGEVIVTSRTLAEDGFLTGDIGVVRSGFAARYPELVVKYLETQVRAIRFYRENPQEAAASVAGQFKLAPEEAARQMNSLVLLSGEQQLGEAYLGTAESKGQLASVFKETADFLVRQKTIRSAPGLAQFAEAIDPSYLEQVLGR